MPPSRGISVAGHGLRCIRPIPPRLQGTRQLSQSSSQRNVLFSKAPSRPVRFSPSPLATIGRANISLWPWSQPQQGLGFPPPPTREGTPDPASVSTLKPDVSTATNDAVASASNPAPSSTSPGVAEPSLEPTPLPLESVDESLLNAIQTPVISEDHIGFLKEMGIQYGFPYITNTLQFIMEHVHVYAGTEWWATIALSAIVVRSVMFVPFMMGSNHSTKLTVINPYLEEAKERMEQARHSKDPVLQQQVTKEMTGLKNAIGLKMGWVFTPMIFQGLAGFCAFKLMRAMTALPVPGLETGGLLWFQDLTVPDPLFVIPITMGLLMHFIGRMGGEMGAQHKKMGDTVKKMMLYFVPVLMTGFTIFQPAALQLSFFISMLWGVGQGYCFRQLWFRKLFRMELLPSQINKFDRPSHAALVAAAADIKAKGIAYSKNVKISSSKTGKLRTVAAPPLRYEAPRERASREMASFRAPPKVESQATETPPAKKGVLENIRTQAYAMQKDFSAGTGKFMDGARKQVGQAKPKTAREQRAEEYEKRRKSEKKDEAEMRRQGRN